MLKKMFVTSILSCMALLAQAQTVEMQTSQGTIILQLDEKSAPETVNNFVRYLEEGFYEGTIFHRVIPGFMIQGGGFDKDMGRKSTHSPVKYEADNGLHNDRGTIAMARTSDPNSATSQFFINLVDNAFLNHGARGAGYTVFGKVTSGLEVIDQIARTSTRNLGPYQNVPTQPIVIEKVTLIGEQ